MDSIGITTIAFLILFPVLIALILWCVRNDKARSFITVAGSLVIACAAIFCAYEFFTAGPQKFAIGDSLREVVTWVALVIDVALGIYIMAKGLRHKKYIAVGLALIQTILVLWFDLFFAKDVAVTNSLYIDNLSVIMALVIAIIGCGICVYALGYMRDYQRHATGKDRRPTFFAVMFAFLGGMFGIVFSNNLSWMLCAWEVTTVCSFALIGFTRTQEAIDNSFRQIILNLIGGLAFLVALIWIVFCYGTLEFDVFLSSTASFASSGYTFLTYMPLLLLALAGFTKAAQMPFQSWLLGAMVAPTPTSALLHSSTMVKAGVFLLIKMAPCLGFNIPGYTVMLVGGATFLFCSIAAISQTNAKRVLAYSTISNLGLITACAGVGTEGAVWAAIFLLVFHACAKSLLFLCVGTAEHHIGSRDIEEMDNLFERMPKLARLMAIGILGMFVAPFGMLISKWAALQSFAASSNLLLILLLVFGSAATFMFWAKWLGKVLAIANNGDRNVEIKVHRSEWASMGLMTILTVGCCIGFPLISNAVVVPYLKTVFTTVSTTISNGDLWIMAVIALIIAVIFLSFTGKTRKRVVPIYMAGASIDAENRTFKDSFSHEMSATQRNWYMNDMFGEKKVVLVGVVVAMTLLFSSFGFVGQSVADQKEAITSASTAVTSYRDTEWGKANADFSTYMQYYQYYESYFEKNQDELKSLGITSMKDLMNALYEQVYASSTSANGSNSTSGEGE